jgi:hypothetical protein
VAYAWYSFETTGGAKPSNANLLGGTGIIEGQVLPGLASAGYDRGIAPDQYLGDLIYFNTDGSLASTGGALEGTNASSIPAVPRIYLPPINPGTAGVAPSINPIPRFPRQCLE